MLDKLLRILIATSLTYAITTTCAEGPNKVAIKKVKDIPKKSSKASQHTSAPFIQTKDCSESVAVGEHYHCQPSTSEIDTVVTAGSTDAHSCHWIFEKDGVFSGIATTAGKCQVILTAIDKNDFVHTHQLTIDVKANATAT